MIAAHSAKRTGWLNAAGYTIWNNKIVELNETENRLNEAKTAPSLIFVIHHYDRIIIE